MLASFFLICLGLISIGAAMFGNVDGIYYLIGFIAILLGFIARFIISRIDPEGTEHFRKEVKDFFPRGMMDCNLPKEEDHSKAPAFFRQMDKLRPLYDGLYKLLLFVCKLLLVADIAITTWAVAGRYIASITDPHWSEEIILTFMAYMAVLSATLAIRRRAHIRMTIYDNKLPRKARICLDLLADIAVLALGVVLLVQGIKFCNSPLAAKGKYASLPNLSKVWQYLPVPVAGGSMIVFELEQLFQHIEEFFTPAEKEAKQA